MASDRIWEHKTPRAVILDTSGVMMVFEFKIDLEEELRNLIGSFKILVPSTVFDELNKHIDYGKEKKKRLAKPSLAYIKKYEIIKTNGSADEDVISLAEEKKGIIVTNDKEIRKKAKEKLIKTAYLRSKKRLVID